MERQGREFPQASYIDATTSAAAPEATTARAGAASDW